MDANAASYTVIGAAIEVHRALGPGFSERVYESALAIELAHRGVAFQRQHPFEVLYRGQRVGEGRVDLFVEECLVVELKAAERIAPVHVAQVVGYLRALRAPLGLVLNFGCANLRDGIQRVVA
jgi:GxxExxY protein